MLGENPNLGEQNVVKTDKCMGVSQLLGVRAGHARFALPKSTPMNNGMPICNLYCSFLKLTDHLISERGSSKAAARRERGDEATDRG